MATRKSVTTKKNIKLTPKDAKTMLEVEYINTNAKIKDILQFTFEPMPINKGAITFSNKRKDK